MYLNILPKGKIFYKEKGHRNELVADDKFLKHLVSSFSKRKKDGFAPFIDLNHKKEDSYGEVRNAESRPDGLYCDIVFSQEGKELIKKEKYRFLSPCVSSYVDSETGEVAYSLIAISLVNDPVVKQKKTLKQILNGEVQQFSKNSPSEINFYRQDDILNIKKGEQKMDENEMSETDYDIFDGDAEKMKALKMLIMAVVAEAMKGKEKKSDDSEKDEGEEKKETEANFSQEKVEGLIENAILSKFKKTEKKKDFSFSQEAIEKMVAEKTNKAIAIDGILKDAVESGKIQAIEFNFFQEGLMRDFEKTKSIIDKKEVLISKKQSKGYNSDFNFSQEKDKDNLKALKELSKDSEIAGRYESILAGV